MPSLVALAVWAGLLAAPDDIARLVAGLGHPFPEDMRLVEARRGPAGHAVYLDGSFEGPEHLAELRVEALVGALAAAGVTEGVRVFVPGRDGAFRPLGTTAPEAARPPARGALLPASPARPRGEGALAGRRISISAGHGWVADGAGWRAQRSRWRFDGCGSCRGVQEDFLTAQIVSEKLVPLLQGMGAEVVLVRAADLGAQPAETIDDGDPGYEESGTWSAGSRPGGHGDDYRTLDPAEEGTAAFRTSLRGWRRVALRHREGGNRTGEATVEVQHAGGVATLNLDQRRMGRFWLDLGRYRFGAGDGVELSRAAGAGGFLIADAVHFGGGTHPAAGHPWWQMAAKSYVAWAGAPDAVTAAGDVTIRPLYTEHVGADLFVSIHANASGQGGGSSANGLSTYRYSCRLYNDHSRGDDAVNCDDPPGSAALARSVHGAILEHLHAEWDPNYGDVGRRVANFGELRALDGTPGVLVESGFFDNLGGPRGSPPPRYPDNRSLHDPRWREAFARGVAAGVARYFDGQSGAPPPRPDGLVARNQQDGTLQLAWRPVPGASGYRVFRATDGRAWNDGVVVGAPELTLADLEPRRIYAFRVAALDRNGEGFASQAVAVRYRGAAMNAAPSQALLISAYDRRDAWVQDVDNELDYAVEHGHAFGSVPGLFFDGALDEAVPDLGVYSLVVYSAGKDSTEHLAIAPEMRDRLRAFVAGGGALVVSGEEVGYQLVERSDDPAEAAFLADVLGATYVADDADTYDVRGAGPLESVGEVRLDDGTGGVFEVRFPDVLAAEGAAQVAMTYGDGTAAAIATNQTLFIGAPFEAFVPASARASIARAAVDHLLGPLAPDDPDGGVPDASPTDAFVSDAVSPDGGLQDGSSPDATDGGHGADFEVASSVDSTDTGCGCDTGGGSWSVLGLFLVAIRRRRSAG